VVPRSTHGTTRTTDAYTRNAITQHRTRVTDAPTRARKCAHRVDQLIVWTPIRRHHIDGTAHSVHLGKAVLHLLMVLYRRQCRISSVRRLVPPSSLAPSASRRIHSGTSARAHKQRGTDRAIEREHADDERTMSMVTLYLLQPRGIPRATSDRRLCRVINIAHTRSFTLCCSRLIIVVRYHPSSV
jgi:hypothetical protein